MNAYLLGLVLWVGSMAATWFTKGPLQKYWASISIKLRSDVKAKADIYLKDPEIRAIVNMIAAKVQKEAASNASLDKLRQAVNYAKIAIPGPIDDIILEAIFEIAVAEIKKPIVI